MKKREKEDKFFVCIVWKGDPQMYVSRNVEAIEKKLIKEGFEDCVCLATFEVEAEDIKFIGECWLRRIVFCDDDKDLRNLFHKARKFHKPLKIIAARHLKGVLFENWSEAADSRHIAEVCKIIKGKHASLLVSYLCEGKVTVVRLRSIVDVNGESMDVEKINLGSTIGLVFGASGQGKKAIFLFDHSSFSCSTKSQRIMEKFLSGKF